MASRGRRRTRIETRKELPHSRVAIVRARVAPKLVLRQIEDRRLFHPEGRLAPALSFSRRDQRRVVIKRNHVAEESGNPFLSPRVAFAVPERVAICVRRKQRREVIHAKRLVKRGAGAGRRRRTSYSDIDCR